jgi:hypothetical protein
MSKARAGELLYPTEQSRFLFAASASVIVFGVLGLAIITKAGVAVLLLTVLVLAFTGGVVWVTLQIGRARLLGSSLQVTKDSLPEVHAALEDVRERLDYRRRIDVYIVSKGSAQASMTSYLGTKVILLEGSLVAGLLGEAEHTELAFLLARFVGALKARHARFTVVLVLLNVLGAAKVLNPFLAPYTRATIYSGDQLGLACCGNLDAALRTTERLLVGKELAPGIARVGLIEQAASVHRRVLPRLVQLFAPEPHLTNRYLNLLAFAGSRESLALASFRASLDTESNRHLDFLLGHSPHSRAHGRAPSWALTGGFALITAGILAGAAVLMTSGGGSSTAAASAATPVVESSPATTPTTSAPAATTPATTETTPATTETTPAPDADLVAHVPASFGDSCESTDSLEASTAVECSPTSADGPDFVDYYQYDDTTAMDAQFDKWAGNVPKGDYATEEEAQGRWSNDNDVGRVARYTTKDGRAAFLWTDETLDILALATSDTVDLATMYDWWHKGDSGPVD